LEWISHGVAIPWLTSTPPPGPAPSNQGVSCRGLPPDQATFLQEVIDRLASLGFLRPVNYARWVSHALLEPKSSANGWRLVVDLPDTQNEDGDAPVSSPPSIAMRPLGHLRLKDGFYTAAITSQAERLSPSTWTAISFNSALSSWDGVRAYLFFRN
jgi:hypothetical protein